MIEITDAEIYELEKLARPHEKNLYVKTMVPSGKLFALIQRVRKSDAERFEMQKLMEVSEKKII